MKRISLIFIIIGSLTACSLMQRRNTSNFADSGSEEEAIVDSEQVRTLSPEEREKFEDQMLLTRLERNLHTNEERQQYNRYKVTLENDRERIEFLSLDGANARERYLQSKGYTSSPSRYNRDIASLIEQNDIALGMAKQAVRESWGDPAVVEYAGRPGAGNERWSYKEYIPTSEGYQEEQRVLYFENGVLVGWEKH